MDAVVWYKTGDPEWGEWAVESLIDAFGKPIAQDLLDQYAGLTGRESG